ncbi:MAG: Flp pilus assembly protein CpaB [Sneathiellales bacterium]|nr:Flp pilus assembly protein CpaB [Sneathiellales bacterium]
MARKLILVLFALIIAGSTVWFVRNWAGNQNPQVVQQTAEIVVQQQKPTVEILVAASNLPAGTLLREEHVTWQAWPESDDLEERYFVKEKREVKDLIGTVVRQGIATGEPLSDGRIVKPGQSGFLAAVLRPGTRAVSIEINATSGVAGFVFPGDRVDLILTMQITNQQDGGEGSRTRASETILTDVRIVAMDQSTNDQSQEASVSRVATLEVTPKEAEIVSLSQELGRLSLSLRSIARLPDEKDKDVKIGDIRAGRGFTRDSDVSDLISAPSVSGSVARKVIIYRSGQSTQQSFE